MRSDETLQDEMRRFFEDFVVAFAEFDGPLIARRYAAPYLALNARGEARLFASAETIGAYFQGIVEQYFAQGCRHCRFHGLHATALGANAALASVSWELLSANHEVLSAWRESYNLARTSQGWRIHASTDHAEQESDSAE
jgi:hypothetical protein